MDTVRHTSGKGHIMIKKWNLLIGLVAAVMMMVGVAACAVIASPPQDLIAKNDHAGLEAWYVEEAAISGNARRT